MPSASCRKIVIVDDDREVRGSLESLMRSAGFEAQGFDQAESFLDAAVGPEACCIVTDMNMPGMNGLEFQLELRRRGCMLPVIVMTAFPTEGSRIRALAQGAVAFLPKPLDPDLLLDTIEQALAPR